MKKALSFILGIALFMSSLSLSSCEKTEPNEPVTTETETEAVTELPPAPKPVFVEKLNGMSAYQLFGKFFIEYSNAKTYDVAIKTDSTVDGTTTSSSVAIKLGENALYVNIDADESKMECWFLEDVSYLNIAGEKIKISGSSSEDIFGDGFIEQAIGGAFSSMDLSAYNKKLRSTQLFFYNGEYYYTVEFTEEEAAKLGIAGQNFSETVFFDEEGRVKRVVDSSDSETVTMLLNAYGTPVTVNAPADADAYVEQPDGGNDNQDAPSTNGNAGKQDPEVYAIYEAAFDAIESISDYLICITKNGEVELYYTFRATQQYENINLLQEDGTRLWIEYTNGKGYVYDTEGNSGFVETAVDEEFLATLELGRALKELLLALELHGNDMENLSFVNFSRDDLSYSHDRGDGWVDQYHIRLLRTIHGIETVIITVTSFHNGEKCDTIEYYFTEDILIT